MSNIKYESTESVKCFQFSNLANKVKAELRAKNPDLDNESYYDLMNKSLNTFRINGQSFEYLPKQNHLGGYRWFVKCPKCEAPSLKLYLPDSLADREQIYACKRCHMLKNTSALMGATNKYQKVVKPLKKLESIKRQLLKKNMNPEKAKILIDEYERIERSLENSAEYKYWKFKKRYNQDSK